MATSLFSISSPLRQGSWNAAIRAYTPFLGVLLFVALAYALVSAFSVALLNVSALHCLIFALFQFACALLPGLVLASLTAVGKNNAVLLWALAFGFGYCVNVLEYILVVPVFGPSALTLVCPLVSVIVLAVGRRQISCVLKLRMHRADFVALACLSALVLFVYAVLFSTSNYFPTVASGNSYYCDNLFWIGNSVELKIEFPPVDFRTLREGFYYHLFSSMQIAEESLVTGIPVSEITFRFQFIPYSFLIVFAFYGAFLTASKSRMLSVLLVLIFLLTSGQERMMIITWMHHLYIGQIDTPVMLSMGLLFVVMFSRAFFSKQRSIVDVALAGVLLFCCFGTKSTASVLLLVFVFFMCFMGLFNRPTRRFSLIVGSVFLIVSLVCFVAFVVDPATFGETASKLSGREGVTYFLTNATPDLNRYHELFVSSVLPAPLGEALYALFYCVCGQPAVMCLFLVAAAICILRWRCLNVEDVALVAMVIAGMTLVIVIGHTGFSQTQFLTGSYPFALLFVAKQFGSAENWRFSLCGIQEPGRFRVIAHKLLVSLTCMALVFGVAANVEYNWNHYLQYHAKKALGFVSYGNERQVPVPLEETGIMYSYTTFEDYEIYSWLRDNTPVDSLVVVDKTVQYPRYVFEPGAFSERHVYSPGAENDYTWLPDSDSAIRGERIIAEAFDGNSDALVNLKQRGVSYLVYTDGVCTALEDSPLVKLVFENGGGQIFQML